ncbi:hypothetical protein BTO06_09845 [Tenacibaculum sp. SZ-18]|uniref:terminase small subunit n=1 Tax=Tenacibaculum sp. SZ-18 TaxID=754423 RepID=UPI000C2D2ECD|nr:terminase small subunit [Tenacibaculum sp. SZ-18]AUC15422.1 hypothetical protein BTO06_09845 [Tenacibaculum sp. SZ-18]
MGKNKYIETPERMWELFTQYKEDVDTNPLTRKDWVGKDAEVVNREYTRALTMEGFECFVMNHTEITYPDLTEYFEGKNESYKDYFPICSRIRREIRKDQIEKGLAGLINPSITQRLNGLVDKKETRLDITEFYVGDDED